MPAWRGRLADRQHCWDGKAEIATELQRRRSAHSTSPEGVPMLSARLYAIPHTERAPRIAEALSSMGLAESADRLVRYYSGGMICRLGIAQAMLHHLDSPIS